MPAEIIGINTDSYHPFTSRGDLKAVAVCAGSGGATVYLHFWGGTAALPADRKSGSNYLLSYRYADMPAILDMLRKEAPISLISVSEGTNHTRVRTSSEPVGEAERHTGAY